jgi:hypothetical protein
LLDRDRHEIAVILLFDAFRGRDLGYRKPVVEIPGAEQCHPRLSARSLSWRGNPIDMLAVAKCEPEAPAVSAVVFEDLLKVLRRIARQWFHEDQSR